MGVLVDYKLRNKLHYCGLLYQRGTDIYGVEYKARIKMVNEILVRTMERWYSNRDRVRRLSVVILSTAPEV